MANVLTFTNIVPPARTDGVAWTSIQILFATEQHGEYALIDTKSISPLDSNPSNPLARSFSTSEAPSSEGWVRLTFVDNDSNMQSLDEIFMQPTTPSEIAALVQSMMPTSYDALCKSDTYGESLIMLRIKSAKYEKLPLALADADESTYTFLLKDYVACVAALQLIPAAIDHWMRNKIQASNTGTNENNTFPDPIEHLKLLSASLTARVAALESHPDLVPNFATAGEGPSVDTEGLDYITVSPWDFPPGFQPSTTVAA